MEDTTIDDYTDIFSTFEDEDVQTVYLYKKQENSKRYGWICTFNELSPDFNMIAKKFGSGCYKVIIIKKKDQFGKKERIERSFIIDDFHKLNNDVANRTEISQIVSEILKSILPLVNEKKNDVFSNSKVIEQIYMSQIKGYSEIIKDMKSQNQHQIENQNNETYIDDDTEENEGDEMENIFEQLENYLPAITGKNALQVKEIMSNPIVKSALKMTFGGYLKDNKISSLIKEWLMSKLGSEITNIIIQAIF